MNELNKIFFGPAGTGKTRKTIIEAIRIIKTSEKLYLEYNENDYNDIQKNFKNYAKMPKLLIDNNELISKIQNLAIPAENIAKAPAYEGYLKSLTENIFDKEKVIEKIQEYRAYPFIETVTFHPSYSYQDFVEGIGVETTEKSQVIYKAKDGIFKKICERAVENPDYNYVLIIDEINRGDISSIFGELFTLLEDTKRQGENEELSINLPYSKDNNGNPKKLLVPKNLYILATMNTVDKSIALIDVALRRRFEFIECLPEYDLIELKSFEDFDVSKFLKIVNERISILKNEHYQIGHSYFINLKSFDDFKNIMKKKIIPLLQEYFYDDWQSICAVLNQSYQNPQSNKLLILNQSNTDIFKKEFDELREFRNKKVFKIKDDYTVEDIKVIYE